MKKHPKIAKSAKSPIPKAAGPGKPKKPAKLVKPEPSRPVGRPQGESVVAESLAQAAAILEIPKPALQWAKAQGCLAFRGPRVRIEEFKAWWEEHGDAFTDVDGLPLEDILDRKLKALRLSREEKQAEIDAKKYTLTTEVCGIMARIGAEQQSALLAIPRELTPILLGQDAIGISQMLTTAVSRVLEIFQTGAKQFIAPPEWFYEI